MNTTLLMTAMTALEVTLKEKSEKLQKLSKEFDQIFPKGIEDRYEWPLSVCVKLEAMRHEFDEANRSGP